MRLAMENWRSFQINEGILESETTQISRMIVDKIKRLVQAGTLHQSPVEKHYIEVTHKELPETLKDTAKMHAVVVRLTKVDQEKRGIPRNKRATGNPVRISGQFKGGLYRELTIFLRIYMDLAPTPEEFMQSINGWLPSLKNLLRHEIEHARQHTKDDQGKYDKYSASGMGVYGDRRAAIEYFQSKEEKEAYVVGLYKKAKTEKKPFKEVFDDWIIEMRFHMLMNKKGEEEMPDSEVKKEFDQIERDYLEYAKQRFPAAQGIQESWRRFLTEQRGDLGDLLEIRESPIHGLGVFAVEDIPAHTNLGPAQISSPDGGYQITDLGKHHNHSYQPTCYNKMTSGVRNLYSSADLKAGDEVTVDYTHQPELEQPKAGWK